MKETIDALALDITIEELEPKIAPDGETVLPLGKIKPPIRKHH